MKWFWPNKEQSQYISLGATTLFNLLTIGVAVAHFWWLAVRGTTDLLWSAALFLTWILVAVVWLGRMIKWAFAPPHKELETRLSHYAFIPSLVIFLTVIVQTDTATSIVFWLNRPLLNSAAKQVLTSQNRQNHPDRIGLYRVLKTERIADGVAFTVSKGGFIDTTFFGFAYFPSRRAPKNFHSDQRLTGKPEYGPQALGDGWFWFRSVQFFD